MHDRVILDASFEFSVAVKTSQKIYITTEKQKTATLTQTVKRSHKINTITNTKLTYKKNIKLTPTVSNEHRQLGENNFFQALHAEPSG